GGRRIIKKKTFRTIVVSRRVGSRRHAGSHWMGRDLVSKRRLPENASHRLLRVLLPHRGRRRRLRTRSGREIRYRPENSHQKSRQSPRVGGSRFWSMSDALAAIAVSRTLSPYAARGSRGR